MNGIIYMIFCRITKKVYIGQTVRKLEERINDHWGRARRRATRDDNRWADCIKLCNAIKKHDPYFTKSNFHYGVIDEVPVEQLDEKEKYYIRLYDSITNGYNLKEGGANGKFSEETKRKISLACIGRVCSEETKKILSRINTGKKHSAESRRKISMAQIGRKASMETRLKLSGENHHMFGKHHSEDALLKIREHSRKKMKPVTQLDHNGNVLNVFESTLKASSETGVRQGNISSAATGRIKTAGGYFWKYS